MTGLRVAVVLLALGQVDALGELHAKARDQYWKQKDIGAAVETLRKGIKLGLANGKRAEAKAMAYDLASFTWPGWAEEGIRIGPVEMEAGLKAARLNLELAKELEKGHEDQFQASWVLGAQLLAHGQGAGASVYFKFARFHAMEARDRPAELMAAGYSAIAAGDEEELAASIASLEKDGSDDATFYAGQLTTAWKVFGRPAKLKLHRRIQCGPLTLEVSLSRTAQLFHVVDQLAAWSPYCHSQYRRAMSLDKEDEEILKPYAAIRRAKGWGGGMEETFYTREPLETALFEGLKAGRLTNEEVETLRKVLTHFEPKVDALVEEHRETLETFVKKIDKALLTKMAKSLGRFCEVEKLTVPVYPIVNPGPGWGGGYNGRRLTLEVLPDPEFRDTFLHELSHAFYEEKKEAIVAAARATPGLDSETLGEGLAYAFAPGIHHVEKGDPLADAAAYSRKQGGTIDGKSGYLRFRLYGLALRPLLTKALRKGTLVAFLPEAREAWWALLREEQARKKRGPLYFSAGPGWAKARDRVLSAGKRGIGGLLNHGDSQYDQIFRDARPGDLVALLVTPEAMKRVPAAADSIVPLPALKKDLAEGRKKSLSVELHGVRVVLLAAPTLAELEDLIAESALLLE